MLPELLPGRQKWFPNLAKVRHIVNKLADAIVEPSRANVVLNDDRLVLKQLAGNEQGAALLARQRFDEID